MSFNNLFKKEIKNENIFNDNRVNTIYQFLLGIKTRIEEIDSSAKALLNQKSDLFSFWESEYLEFNKYIDKSYPLINRVISNDSELNQLILKQFKNISLPSNFNEKRIMIKLNLVNNMITSLKNYSNQKNKIYKKVA